MSQAATTNFFIQSGTHLIVQFKEASAISSTTIVRQRNNHSSQTQSHEAIMSSRQAIFAFIVTASLNFLQVKYQGKDLSPFETHPKVIFGAVTSLLVYCWSYDAKLKLSAANQSTHIHACCFLRATMAFSGPLSIASISSLLFPQSLGPLLFSLSLFFSICQLSHIKRIWSWLRAVVMNKLGHQLHHQHGRRRGLISAELPGFPDHGDILPPV